MTLKGKTSVVTGGSLGIGKATCKVLAEEGSKVAVVDIAEDAGLATVREIKEKGQECVFIKANVTISSDVKDAVATAVDRFAKIDILVNCAGGPFVQSASENFSEADWDKVTSINLKGTFLSCQAFGRRMIEQKGGTIVNTASITGLVPQLGNVAYAASKAGVIALTRHLAAEWAAHNIRVNAVAPGRIKSERVIAAMEAAKAAHVVMPNFRIPLGRIGEPFEVANAIKFLVSEESSYVTGHVLLVDGGELSAA
jgi:NAD(P)-dependent dehydrogenase (short-subunit alcohol dehydrogenase family)